MFKPFTGERLILNKSIKHNLELKLSHNDQNPKRVLGGTFGNQKLPP